VVVLPSTDEYHGSRPVGLRVGFFSISQLFAESEIVLTGHLCCEYYFKLCRD
jgi:hypothetical protein